MSGLPVDSLGDAALAVLACDNAALKASLARETAARWRAGALTPSLPERVPPRPGRPARPELLPPQMMPRRRGGALQHRIALLHAVAHIELNAIDLAFDILARFGQGLPRDFLDDWIGVGDDEARHYMLLAGRLADLGASYGDLPAHDGLWQAAEETAGDLLARLAIVPMVLEARGLDVTPAMIDRFEQMGDSGSAAALRTIYRDEIGHVGKGQRWFRSLCDLRGFDPAMHFHMLVKQHFRGRLRPPFNSDARLSAGLTPDYYEPLATASG